MDWKTLLLSFQIIQRINFNISLTKKDILEVVNLSNKINASKLFILIHLMEYIERQQTKIMCLLSNDLVIKFQVITSLLVTTGII
jgi:hypothetical protein